MVRRRGIIKFLQCPIPGRMSRIVPKQCLCLNLLLRNGQKRKWPRPGILDTGSAVTATIYHSVEQTHNSYCGDGISISPRITTRKGNVEKITSK